MSNNELELNLICKRLSKISVSDWVAIKFEKQIPANDIEPLRFCELANVDMKYLSIEEGSNMVRIGTAIFGERIYK